MRNKFNARKVTIDGITFDSEKEGRRYQELKLLERANEISRLELQPAFKHTVNGEHCFTYKADFSYFTNDKRIIEDVKGFKKGSAYAHFRTKKKCIEAQYGLEIVEI